MGRLICVFVVCIQQRQVFLCQGPYHKTILNFSTYQICIKAEFKHSARLELPPDFFCQTSFWQNDLVLLSDIDT